ncbi:MAG TPA: phage head closure protein [Dissulfurispiraceae bacterium]|nr:phage head closure protein [Dissulfurispiraceae bacterium]
MNTVIELVTHQVASDNLGQQSKIPVYREVFAEELPVRMSEFFAAGQQGIKPQLAVRVWTDEYAGEEHLKHHGVTYRIYRVYKDPKLRKTELYCEVRVGGN